MISFNFQPIGKATRSKRKKTLVATQYGYGRWNTTRVHYRPSPTEIELLCQRIREEGYTDARNRYHPPWDENTETERRVESMRNHPVGSLTPISTRSLTQYLSDDEWLELCE